MFALSRYATIEFIPSTSSSLFECDPKRWGGCGLRVPRHKLKMAFARPLSLNARLRKSRDREQSIITHKNCERGLISNNRHGAARTASLAQPPRRGQHAPDTSL